MNAAFSMGHYLQAGLLHCLGDVLPERYRLGSWPIVRIHTSKLLPRSAESMASYCHSPSLRGATAARRRASGVDFEGESWFAMFAPAATPLPLVATLRGVVADVLRDADFAARVDKDGGRVLAVPPAEQAKFLQDEIERWSGLVTRYGVGVD